MGDEVLLQCVPMVADLGESINSLSRTFKFTYIDGFSLGGAPAYLPPEIRQARSEVDQLDYTKSDVYGLGCVMYEMMHREPVLPIRADTGLRAQDFSRGYSLALRQLVADGTAVQAARCSILGALQKLVTLSVIGAPHF
eukprot:TRINITY_DN4219_c0_g1_i1.p1 TRINITY_DN4219_c0_g1~~TRINITY_DN4219_c0_g1_i1.p1  ORF type:complete len:147 (+),score=37.66 TRINITY_DN4219_c0_g1_i1:26-442(+)